MIREAVRQVMNQFRQGHHSWTGEVYCVLGGLPGELARTEGARGSRLVLAMLSPCAPGRS